MIELDGITKRYGTFTALDGVSFTAGAGRVTGYLGPNGAGKSTSMRILTGLAAADSGRALIGGLAYRRIPNPGRHVGVLLDASAQHAGRTGREALEISAATMGLPAQRVTRMLEQVGLSTAESKRRVKNYSLGMRQRLGIAAALLGEPEVLILDEPANGLDPAGIRWMRGLLKDFADAGGTVLLSSHLLHEVEMIADDIVLIGGGRIMAQGTKEDLLSRAGTTVRALDEAGLAEALHAAGLECRAGETGGMLVSAEPVDVGRAAAAAGVVLTELRATQTTGLEDLFLSLTADQARDRPARQGRHAERHEVNA